MGAKDNQQHQLILFELLLSSSIPTWIEFRILVRAINEMMDSNSFNECINHLNFEHLIIRLGQTAEAFRRSWQLVSIVYSEVRGKIREIFYSNGSVFLFLQSIEPICWLFEVAISVSNYDFIIIEWNCANA